MLGVTVFANWCKPAGGRPGAAGLQDLARAFHVGPVIVCKWSRDARLGRDVKHDVD